MPTYTFQKPHQLTQLHDELLAALPSVRPITDATGEQRAVLHVEGKDDTGFLRITVPHDGLLDRISAVVAAHIPDPSYGSQLQPTEVDVLAMDEPSFRRWVMAALLDLHPPT